MLETCREKENQLFMEGKGSDASSVLLENPFFLLVNSIPNNELRVQTCRSQELEFGHGYHCHDHSEMTFIGSVLCLFLDVNLFLPVQLSFFFLYNNIYNFEVPNVNLSVLLSTI